MKKNKEKQTILHVFQNIFLMLKYIGKYTPGLLIWITFTSILSGFIAVLDTVYLAKYVLDGIEKKQPFAEMVPFFAVIFALNLLLALLRGLYNGSYFPRKKTYLIGKMHEELFVKARNMELACYDNPNFYNDFVWAMSEADEKAIDILNLYSEFLGCFTTVAGTVSIVVSINFFGLILIVLCLCAEFFLQKIINRLDFECSLLQKPLQRKRDYSSRIMYQPEYAKEIRLTSVKELLSDNFSQSNQHLIDVLKKYKYKILMLYIVSNVMLNQFLLNGVYLSYLLYQTLVYHAFTAGNIYAVFSGTTRFNKSWSDVVYFFSKLKKESLYIERFRNFLEYEPVMKNSADGLPMPDFSGKLELDHISFTYEGMTEPTIKDLSLTIQPGEKVALVGYNGAGKTTLIKLLMRLYDVNAGSVFIAGNDIRSYRLSELRDYFGVVFQDYQLLAATVGENVIMNRVEETNEPAIFDALKKSGFSEKLSALADNTKTMVSREFDKDGVLLSGGEGQKLAISRIFPRNCKIVILDEPSSALDPVSEYNVNQSMLAAAKDKTVLFISHRLSTTRLADRIIMLENGRIIEQGSHEELMQLNGKYAEMFHMQADKYKENAVS